MMQGNNHSHYLQSEQRFEGVRMFRKDFIDSRQALSSSDSFERYSFQVKRPSPSQVIDFSSLAISQNKLIGGSTISGNAVQLAHLCGAREILLCGVDMSGDHYFDGSHNVCLTHGETWTFTPTFNRLIHWLHQNTDTTVSSLSPTKLTVPRFAHQQQSVPEQQSFCITGIPHLSLAKQSVFVGVRQNAPSLNSTPHVPIVSAWYST